MNISRYQQLLQQRFGQPSAMKTSTAPDLDAALARGDNRRELQLGRAGMQKKAEDQSMKMGKERLGLNRAEFNMDMSNYKRDLSNMKTANWMNLGGIGLGLGQGMIERNRYNKAAELAEQNAEYLKNLTQKYNPAPVENYGLGRGYR